SIELPQLMSLGILNHSRLIRGESSWQATLEHVGGLDKVIINRNDGDLDRPRFRVGQQLVGSLLHGHLNHPHIAQAPGHLRLFPAGNDVRSLYLGLCRNRGLPKESVVNRVGYQPARNTPIQQRQTSLLSRPTGSPRSWARRACKPRSGHRLRNTPDLYERTPIKTVGVVGTL